MIALDKKYERTPLPVDISKLPPYLRPIKPVVSKIDPKSRQVRETISQEWTDYFAQYGREEI